MVNFAPKYQTVLLKQHLTCKNYDIYVSECKFGKMQYVGQIKINFLPDGITTAHSGTNLALMMTMTELPFLNIFINFYLKTLLLNLTSKSGLWLYLYNNWTKLY